MYVDAMFGQEGDTTTLSSQSLMTDNRYACLSLSYYQKGHATGTLSVVFEYNMGNQEVSDINNDDTQDRWFIRHLRFEPGLSKLYIIVTHGDDMDGVIAIDDIDLLEDNHCIGRYDYIFKPMK